MLRRQFIDIVVTIPGQPAGTFVRIWPVPPAADSADSGCPAPILPRMKEEHMPNLLFGRTRIFAVIISLTLFGFTSPLTTAQTYRTQALVSDQAGTAPHIDANLINAWGLSYSPTGPFWVADEATAVSTLYNGSGVPQSLIVTIP